MGRSQETFSKKENERKKQKKRKDKAEKREERKSNSDKGKSFEEMLAYVDENGNLTDTPPDPKKKKVFKEEDMQIGVFRRAAEEPQDLLRTGVVTFFNESKGFGFIKDSVNNDSVFVHINSISGPVKENDKVTFNVESGHKGLNAVNVVLVK
ncbi:MAG: cold shock domain-containing protein [Bacteroidia bacterium]|nr:cold shock domain-containing protein [Bacteroidia bacterium]MBP9689476.1 cold shock domain-containing protein [Bacteroidia bacterium]